MATRQAIAPINDALPICTPSLMPFHIGYSGPAPISTYMRVEPSNGTVGAPPTKTEQGGNGESSASADDDAKGVESLGEESGAPQMLQSSAGEVPPKAIESGAPRRYTSTFRGRTIHSLDIDLPEGYTGLVLRTEGQGRSNNLVGHSREARHGDYPRTRAKRVTRRSKAIVTRDEDGEVELEMSEKVVQRVECMDLTEDVEQDDHDLMLTRVLIPATQFSSFRLWNADIPADEGVDEYTRSLTEWIKLAHHIHQVPP